jgi:hypothetical protein
VPRQLFWIVLLAVSATTALFAPLSAQEPGRDDKGALAVLRRDGVLLPFASFERDFWEITWPLSFRDIKLPGTLEQIPEKWWGKGSPKRWRAYTVSGTAIDISLRAVGAYRPFCVDRLGLATTYKSSVPLPLKPVFPYPKDGVAVSGNIPVEPIESVNPASPEAPALLAQLAKHFDQAEGRTILQVRSNTGWKHRFDDEERKAIPIRLESWYRSPSSEPGWTVSYIEASRAYPPGPEDKGCGLETFVSGWMHHNRGELGKATVLSAKLTYCDRVGVVYMLPFGRIRPRTRDYWSFQLSGWEAEWYDVAEVGREKVRHVIEMNAGGCRF